MEFVGEKSAGEGCGSPWGFVEKLNLLYREVQGSHSDTSNEICKLRFLNLK